VAPLPCFAIESPLIGPVQSLSPGLPEAQGQRENRFLDSFVQENHVLTTDLEAVSGPVSRVSFSGCDAKGGKQRHVSPARERGVSLSSDAFSHRLNHPELDPAYVLYGHGAVGPSATRL
jgi:hypothetical protein